MDAALWQRHRAHAAGSTAATAHLRRHGACSTTAAAAALQYANSNNDKGSHNNNRTSRGTLPASGSPCSKNDAPRFAYSAKGASSASKKVDSWCASNTAHRPPEHPHKPHTAAYVHVRPCLNGACFSFFNLGKLRKSQPAAKETSSASKKVGRVAFWQPHMHRRNTRTSHARLRMCMCASVCMGLVFLSLIWLRSTGS